MFTNTNPVYDEDLSRNPFYVELQNDHPDIFHHCVLDGWILCVPRIGSLHTSIFLESDYYCHVLVPNEELPKTHYYNLAENVVTVSNKIVSIQQSNALPPFRVKILFEETFYTENNMKYIVWCVEAPFNRPYKMFEGNNLSYKTMSSLKECVEFLWTESGSKDVLEHIDTIARCFKRKRINHDNIKLDSLRDNVGSLFNNCLNIALKNKKLNDNSNMCQSFMNNVRLAVETHMYHSIYTEVFDGIITCSANDDAMFNKIIRNLSDVQLCDLGINNEFVESIPAAKKYLSHIESFSTVLGKIVCIKNTISAIKKKSSIDNNVLSADELLPIMIFLVLKTNLSNWHAHLNFLKSFRFSCQSNNQFDEASYVVSTLEAVIEHIKSKLFIGCCLSESQLTYVCNNQEHIEMIDMKKSKSDSILLPEIDEFEGLDYLFKQIKLSNCDKVKDILEKSTILLQSNNSLLQETKLEKHNVSIEDILNGDNNKQSPDLCHPLCDCTKCRQIVSKTIMRTSPTVFTCDNRGFTALHVACIYGNPQIVDLLIEMGAQVNATDYNESTPLHYAASKGNQNALLLLLHAKANINAENMDRNTALHLASNNGHEPCVKALIYFAEYSKVALNIDKENDNGDTPLHAASKWGYAKITNLLLDYGADPWKNNCKGKCAINIAHSNIILKILCSKNKFLNEYVNVVSVNKNVAEIIDSNFKSKLDLYDFNEDKCFNQNKNVQSIKPQTMDGIRQVERLFRAISYGDVKLACFYMNINIEDTTNNLSANTCHPLCNCDLCKAFKCKVQSDLVYNPNTSGLLGNTALHVATQNGIIDMCKILLDHNAIVDIQNNNGQTALHIACHEGRISVVRLLLEYEANVDVKDINGNTPLHLVCMSGNVEIVKLLLKKQCNVCCVNLAGKKALDEAKDRPFPTIVSLLKELS